MMVYTSYKMLTGECQSSSCHVEKNSLINLILFQIQNKYLVFYMAVCAPNTETINNDIVN